MSDLVNSANTAKTVTVSGPVASSNYSNFYNGSFYFDGSNDYLTMPASSDFEFTGDHTIEFWVYFLSVGGNTIPYATGGSGSADQIYIDASGTLYWGYGQTGAVSTPSGTIKANVWQHIAVSKTGTNLSVFINGVMSGSTTNHSSTIGSSSNAPNIGRRSDGYYVNAYIQDFRVYKGVGKYTSDFLPPATHSDILPDTPSGVATKTALTKINEGSVAFDGTGDYLNFSDSTDFDIGIGGEAFTVEAFTNSRVSGTKGLCGKGGGAGAWNATTGHQWLISMYSNNHYVQWWNGSGLSQLAGPNHFYKVNCWQHIALAYDGTTLRFFVDGKQSLSGAATFGKPSSSNIFRIGDIAVSYTHLTLPTKA